MKKSYSFYFILFSIAFSIQLSAQNADEKLKQADEYFSNKEYSKAADAYKKILESDQTKNNVRYKLASTYYSLGKYDDAAAEYKILAPNGNPTVLYNLACVLSIMEKMMKLLIISNRQFKRDSAKLHF